MQFAKKKTLNCNGKLVVLDAPKVMGILNLTPDSFFDGGKYQQENDYLQQVEQMLADGADFIDVGGMSSRPGADIIDTATELERVIQPIESILKRFPNTIISIDTVNAQVAKAAVEAGALIVNDISAGDLDAQMLDTVGKLNVPYIMMHMQGQPDNMQDQPNYNDVVLEVLDYFIAKQFAAKAAGIKDIIIDPGFGFGKTIAHNYSLLQRLAEFDMLQLPILAGISRKSMIYKVLSTDAQHALNGTTALHMVALQNGANILRVHDVKAAKECVLLFQELNR